MCDGFLQSAQPGDVLVGSAHLVDYGTKAGGSAKNPDPMRVRYTVIKPAPAASEPSVPTPVSLVLRECVHMRQCVVSWR